MIVKSIGWLNENAKRAYPFIEDTQRYISANGTVITTVPDDFLLDFRLSSILPVNSVRLYSISVSSASLTVSIEYTVLGTQYYHTIQVSALVDYPQFISVKDDTSIYAVFGAGVDTLLALPEDDYSVNGVEFIPTCITSTHGASIDSMSGSYTGSVALQGDIKVQEGYNIRAYVSGNELILAAIPGAGAGFSCESLSEIQPDYAQGLLAVNGTPASITGDFEVVAKSGISIEPDPEYNELVVRTLLSPTDIFCTDPEIQEP